MPSQKSSPPLNKELTSFEADWLGVPECPVSPFCDTSPLPSLERSPVQQLVLSLLSPQPCLQLVLPHLVHVLCSITSLSGIQRHFSNTAKVQETARALLITGLSTLLDSSMLCKASFASDPPLHNTFTSQKGECNPHPPLTCINSQV